MTVVLIGAVALVGVALSPLLDAAVARAAGDEPLLDGIGRCPSCGARRSGLAAVPLIGWFGRGGSCATCGVRRPVSEPVVAIGNGALWMAAGWRFGAHLPLLVYLAFFSTVLVLSFVDLATYLLPNRLTYPALAASSTAIVVISLVSLDDPWWRVANASIGAVAWGGFLLVLLVAFHVVTGQEGLGLGDVKLAGLLGLHVGWLGAVLVIPALFVAGVAGLIAGIVAMVVRSGERRPYPFGPWLATGAVVAILASRPLLDAVGW